MLEYLRGTPGPSGFGSGSTCYDVAEKLQSDIKGKVVMVTGANSGIGVHTALAVAQQGATVVLACRSREGMHALAERIRSEAAGSTVHELQCDLSSMDSVRKCAEDFNALNLPLNVLINNAGVMGCPWGTTKEGWETQFGTNHLGHFLLTNLLLPKLKEGAPSRVVNVASYAHNFAPPAGVLWDHLKSDEKYDRFAYYGQSKLCNMLHAMVLNERLSGTGVSAVSLHPGSISTKLARHSFIARVWYAAAHLFLKSEPQGAATSVYCAFAAPREGAFEACAYYSDCNLCAPGHAAYTPEKAQKLWLLSVEATGSDASA